MDMRKTGLLLFFAVLLFCTHTDALAGVNVHVGINVPPPVFAIPTPPPVVVIPRTYVYFIPDIEIDIFFHKGYWYRPYDGRWYRSRSYNGPWVFVVEKRVPVALLRLPHDFRHAPPVYKPVPYGHFKKNWRKWERERYWDRHEERRKSEREWKEDRREERRGRGKHRD